MKTKSFLLFIVLIFQFSCDFFKQENEGIPIARVNGSTLYQHDLEVLLTDGMSEEDSILRITNHINRWATQQLLMNGAKLNLTLEKQTEFNDLVDEYKNDLFIKAYLEGLVKQNIDTTITYAEALDVYESNRENFKLNEELIKFRYVNVSDSNSDLDGIKERFQRFEKEDKKILDSISIQFNSYSLNDSIWIKVDQVVEKIPVVNLENKKELLKKSNFIEFKDSIGLYLMHIKEVRNRNEIAPIEYVMPTIKQIVLNKRKLEFIRQLEKDITKDAIKNNQFEIFE